MWLYFFCFKYDHEKKLSLHIETVFKYKVKCNNAYRKNTIYAILSTFSMQLASECIKWHKQLFWFSQISAQPPECISEGHYCGWPTWSSSGGNWASPYMQFLWETVQMLLSRAYIKLPWTHLNVPYTGSSGTHSGRQSEDALRTIAQPLQSVWPWKKPALAW